MWERTNQLHNFSH